MTVNLFHSRVPQDPTIREEGIVKVFVAPRVQILPIYIDHESLKMMNIFSHSDVYKVS